MDISKWTPDEILCLPDFVFGRKFPVFCTVIANSTFWQADISERGFPDPCVLWQVSFLVSRQSGNTIWFRLGMSESLPASEEEFMTLQPFLHGLGETGPEPRKIITYMYGAAWCLDLKTFMRTSGRRLCACAAASVAGYVFLHVAAIVSCVPKEVPDWVFSGQVRSQ